MACCLRLCRRNSDPAASARRSAARHRHGTTAGFRSPTGHGRFPMPFAARPDFFVGCADAASATNGASRPGQCPVHRPQPRYGPQTTYASRQLQLLWKAGRVTTHADHKRSGDAPGVGSRRIGLPDGWVADSQICVGVTRARDQADRGRQRAEHVPTRSHGSHRNDRSKRWSSTGSQPACSSPFLHLRLLRSGSRPATPGAGLRAQLSFASRVSRRGFSQQMTCASLVCSPKECIWIRQRKKGRRPDGGAAAEHRNRIWLAVCPSVMRRPGPITSTG